MLVWKIRRLAALWFAALLLGNADAALAVSAVSPPLVTIIEDTQVPLASGGIRMPSTGSVSYSRDGATIDASNTDQGYVMCKYSGSSNNLRVQITRSGGATYTYTLNSSGKYEVFPLTSGNGNYTVNIYTHVSGNQYAVALGQSISVSLSNPNLPYLYPNQYINYTADSATVSKAASLAQGTASDLEVVQNVYLYVVNNISYDEQKAATVKSGYLPKVDSILSSGKGICFDYAAVMAAMLRSQNIPTRMEIGYVSGGAYHAWLSVYITDVGWVNGVIYFDGKSWQLMDPTFASGGNSKYVGNGSDYKTQYLY